MRDLQTLLTILGGQQLTAGYLTPQGDNTALGTVMALMAQRDPIVTPGAPISPPDLLNTPAWVGSIRGYDAIFLNGVDGNMDISHNQQAAYLFSGASAGGGIGGSLFTIGNTVAGGTSGSFSGLASARFALPKAGAIQSVSFFAAQAGQSILLGIYMDGGTNPSTLVATSAVGQSLASGPTTLPMTTQPTLNPGNYWLVLQVQASVNGYFNATGGVDAANNSAGWTGSLPATWPTSGQSTGATNFSLYATLFG